MVRHSSIVTRTTNRVQHATTGKPHRRKTPTPAIAAEIDTAITNFLPDKNRAAFAVVGPFVRELVRAAEPTTFDNARRLLTFVSRFVIWEWMRSGCELSPERVLRDKLIGKYVATELRHLAPSTRFDVTRILGTLTTKLTGEPTHRLTLQAGPPKAPYSSAELAELNSWRTGLPTGLSRRNAAVLLSLGAGAGLNPAELIAVERQDITHTAEGDRFVSVRGERARSVPVRREWVPVLDLACESRDGLLFHGYEFDEYPPRPITSFITAHPGKVRLTPQRLRSGWIVKLIDEGVPDNLIARLAGINVPTVARYYHHARPTSIEANLAAITGAGRQAVTR